MKLVPCRGCGESIGFVRSKKNQKWLPVDPQQVSGDEIEKDTIITEDGVILKNPPKDEVGYVPHWDSCPNAEEFRKKGRS